LPAGLASGDVDGDGNLDVVAADAGRNQLLLFLGDGQGGFTRVERDVSGYGTEPLAWPSVRLRRATAWTMWW